MTAAKPLTQQQCATRLAAEARLAAARAALYGASHANEAARREYLQARAAFHIITKGAR